MEEEIKCPLLSRDIDKPYCYDINMVIYKLIKSDILEDEIDKEKAKKICENCKNNQFK